MNHYPVKQVIVIRKDLKMRRGKEIAQASHASMKWLVDAIKTERMGLTLDSFDTQEQEWLLGSFAKVCLQVNSEQELLNIENKAKEIGVKCYVITDNGTTEFNGQPTKTCLALWPDSSDRLDIITGHLKLY